MIGIAVTRAGKILPLTLKLLCLTPDHGGDGGDGDDGMMGLL